MGIGWAEGLLVVLIAAIFLRGDEFTSAARMLGRWMGQAQKMSRSFMEELQREAKSSGLDESAQEIRKALGRATPATKGRPLDELMTALEGPDEAREDPGAPRKPDPPTSPSDPEATSGE